MTQQFPDMNLADEELLDEDEDDELGSRFTEYSIGYAIIYTAFAWSVADEAFNVMKELAQSMGSAFLM